MLLSRSRQPSQVEYDELRANALKRVRGTVQADILKEDQGQNTCIFSTEFSLRMMGDMQQYFIDTDSQFLFSVDLRLSYCRGRGQPHLAAGLYPLNGFTFVEAYLARGMD